MPRVALEPGQNSIERAAIVKTDDGGYRMQLLMFTKNWSEWSPLFEHRGH